MFKAFTTMPHVLLGVWGIVLTVWVIVELINANEKSLTRTKNVSLLATILFWGSYITGGWWYWVYYGGDKAIIKEGAFPAAHGFFMETKEHLFFMIILLSMLLTIIVKNNNLLENKTFRTLALTVAIIVVVFGFGMEFFGSMITKGVKIGLLGL